MKIYQRWITKATLEPTNNFDTTAQLEDYWASNPTVLPAPCVSIQQSFEAILKTFENASYIGELRQRWLEIKKLLKGGLPDAIPAAMQAK